MEPVALILKLPLQWQALVKIETDPDAKQDLLPLQIHVGHRRVSLRRRGTELNKRQRAEGQGSVWKCHRRHRTAAELNFHPTYLRGLR